MLLFHQVLPYGVGVGIIQVTSSLLDTVAKRLGCLVACLLYGCKSEFGDHVAMGHYLQTIACL